MKDYEGFTRQGKIILTRIRGELNPEILFIKLFVQQPHQIALYLPHVVQFSYWHFLNRTLLLISMELNALSLAENEFVLIHL